MDSGEVTRPKLMSLYFLYLRRADVRKGIQMMYPFFSSEREGEKTGAGTFESGKNDIVRY
jgi:hypothetical protein